VGYIHNVGPMCSETAGLILGVFIQNEQTTPQFAKQSFQNNVNIKCKVSNNDMTSAFLLFIYLFIYGLFNDDLNCAVYLTASIYKFTNK
jgi:hypothetical protein